MVLPSVLAISVSWVNNCMFTAHLKRSQLSTAQSWLGGRELTCTRNYDITDTAADVVIVRFYDYAQYADFCRHFSIPE